MTNYIYLRPKFNHPKNEEGVFKDLIEKYLKFGSLYIGVDFDNTICPYGKTELDESDIEFEKVHQLLRLAKSFGMKLCLWSLPLTQENLDWKIQFCKDHGFEMDYVNESPLLSEFSKKFGKPHFNLLLDDVAGLQSSYNILWNICNYITIYKK